MARVSGEVYRFYQKQVDESLRVEDVSAVDFKVDKGMEEGEEFLRFKDQKISERAMKDFSRLVGVPKGLLLESSQATLRILLAERFGLAGIQQLQVTDFDGTVVSFLPVESAYNSPLSAMPDHNNFWVWSDMMTSDEVRMWSPRGSFEMNGEKYRFGTRLLLFTTRKRYIFAEPRVEKEVCSNGMMKMVAARSVARIESGQEKEVLREFIRIQEEEAVAYAEEIKTALSRAAEVPVDDDEVFIDHMLSEGGLTPRAKKKVRAQTWDMTNPDLADLRHEAGVDNPMNTAVDFFQLASHVAKKYSDNARESLEKKISHLLTKVYLAEPGTRGAPWEVQEEVA